LKRNPVLRVKTFSLDQIAFGARHIEDQAAGENAVDIHKQETNLRRALLKLGVHH